MWDTYSVEQSVQFTAIFLQSMHIEISSEGTVLCERGQYTEYGGVSAGQCCMREGSTQNTVGLVLDSAV